jgi:hypothetical protein
MDGRRGSAGIDPDEDAICTSVLLHYKGIGYALPMKKKEGGDLGGFFNRLAALSPAGKDNIGISRDHHDLFHH